MTTKVKEKMTTKRMLLQLKELQDKAGEHLFDRLTLVQQIVSDQEWIGSQGGERKALKHLSSEYFADLCGAMSLPRMLEIRAVYQDKESWQRNGWDLRAMLAELMEEEDKDKPARTRTVISRKDYEALQAELERTKVLLQNEKDDVARLNKELAEKDTALAVARADIERLRGANQELEKRAKEAEQRLHREYRQSA